LIYGKWLLLVVLNLILKYFLAWPLTPIVVLFTKSNGWLPNCLYWFQTNDNSIDGDEGWISGTRPFKINTGFRCYINRCFWLWRNSLYGFNESVLSLTYPPIRDHEIVGDERVSNSPGFSGTVKRYLYGTNHKLLAFQFYYIKQLKRWPNKCIRINLGWKLWNVKDMNAKKAHIVLAAWVNRFSV
jgi:hypothetical protein